MSYSFVICAMEVLSACGRVWRCPTEVRLPAPLPSPQKALNGETWLPGLDPIPQGHPCCSHFLPSLSKVGVRSLHPKVII